MLRLAQMHGICAAMAGRGTPSRPSADEQDGVGADLPAAEDERTHPQHRIWPYLLRHLTIARPNKSVPDVTYIPMRRAFLYLVAIMDWFSRKVLAWGLSNTIDTDLCVTALEEAIARFGRPKSSIPIKARSLPALLSPTP